MKVLIPARGGSKGIPNKNLIDVNGKPLIFYTINEALKVFSRDSIFVSSDSDEILSYSKSLGVQTIKRPSSISEDNSTSSEVINHFIEIINSNEDFDIVYLQPTSPLRTAEHIKESIKKYESLECSSLISVCKSSEYINKVFKLDNQFLEPLLGSTNYKEIRQEIPDTFYPNGAIYIFSIKNFLKNNIIPINNVAPFIMRRVDSIDIDDNIDLDFVRMMLNKK
jgi:N-acylneuraminate cytidylyltransferase